jgi:hypothetical protein
MEWMSLIIALDGMNDSSNCKTENNNAKNDIRRGVIDDVAKICAVHGSSPFEGVSLSIKQRVVKWKHRQQAYPYV